MAMISCKDLHLNLLTKMKMKMKIKKNETEILRIYYCLAKHYQK